MAIFRSRRSDSFLILEGEAKRAIGEYQDSIRRTADFLVLAAKSWNPLAVGVKSRGGIGWEPGPPDSNTGRANRSPFGRRFRTAPSVRPGFDPPSVRGAHVEEGLVDAGVVAEFGVEGCSHRCSLPDAPAIAIYTLHLLDALPHVR